METKRVLVVDDDVDLCDSLKAVLERAGYVAQTAHGRSEGMETIRATRPDLVVLDVMMGTWHDGFDMSRELKGDPELKATPILMLTSVESKTAVEFKSSVGDPTWLPVDRFLDKPVEEEVLLAEIEKLL
jgi:CheY-like chemotaxis protein